jgi:hypothetical protein
VTDMNGVPALLKFAGASGIEAITGPTSDAAKSYKMCSFHEAVARLSLQVYGSEFK